MDLVVPNLSTLVAAVLANSPNPTSRLHGVHHWQCVAWTGLQLVKDVPCCDLAVVFLFGLFHDSMRLNDWGDPEHGQRGGLLARHLHGQYYEVSPAQLDLLQAACDGHTNGHTSPDPTIGVCWDADRLNLWRVGLRPDPAYLSTASAKREPRILWARTLQRKQFTWSEIYQGFLDYEGRRIVGTGD